MLVLAGDIGSYQRRSDGSVWLQPDWGLRAFSPLPQYGAWPTPVLYVPGNHEYDGLDWDKAHAALRATCERLGIVWLERESTVIDGVRFVGTTLWSDYDALAAVPLQRRGRPRPIGDAQAHRLQQRERAFRAANFHLARMGTHRAGRPFDAAAMREEALRCQAWVTRDAGGAVRWPHRGGDTLRALVAQCRPPLWAAAGHGGLLQRDRRHAATSRPVAARPSALSTRLPRGSLPGVGQPLGLCGQKRAIVVRPLPRHRCTVGRDASRPIIRYLTLLALFGSILGHAKAHSRQGRSSREPLI
jgi:hypothetical protein